MGWFAVDDGFDNHPKIRKAGNAAAGLFCRMGAYCSRNATEGIVPGPVARDYGTAPQLRKLMDLGMVHPFGHACSDCKQPEKGGFVMHDYLQYNRSRKEIEDARKAGVERQRKRRARLAAEAAAAETGPPGEVPPATPPGPSGEASGGVAPEPPVSGQQPSSEPHVTADAAGERARTSPAQPHYVPPYGGTSSQQEALPRVGDRPRIPEAARPLVEALTAAGMVVRWDIHATEWFLIEAMIKKTGVDHLVIAASEMWRKAKERPRQGNYFIPGWKGLPEVPAGTPTEPMPGTEIDLLAMPGQNVISITGQRLSGTDANLADHAALIAQLQAMEGNQ
jgi:hypothetical protein